MNTQQDFEELLKLFEQNNVSYVIIGGYAVAFYGYPRFTKDIDIFFNAIDANIAKIKTALCTFGFSEDSLPDNLFTEDGNIIKFGIEPVRVDLLNKIDGIEYETVEKNTVRGKYGEIEVNFISKGDLIINKAASGRPQDLLDIEKLKTN
jgi:hypothetical protein